MRDNTTTPTETNRLMTDGGRDGARREDYWERLASDGGADEDDEQEDDVEETGSPIEETPLSILRSSIDSAETLHAVIPTERDGDHLSVLVIRETEAQDGDGTVFHLRYAGIDLDDRSVAWSSNGMFIGREGNTAVALTKAFASIRDGVSEDRVQAINGLGGGSDDVARDLLSETIEREPVDHSREVVEPQDVDQDGDRVECEKCGKKGPMSEMENFGGGLVDAFVHSGGCPDE